MTLEERFVVCRDFDPGLNLRGDPLADQRWLLWRHARKEAEDAMSALLRALDRWEATTRIVVDGFRGRQEQAC